MRTLLIVCILVVFITNKVFSQNEIVKAQPFLSTGFGYYNQDLKLNGLSEWGEFGLKMQNNYVFIVQASLSENINTIGKWPILANLAFDRIGTHKVFCILAGYEFITLNTRHTFMPMIGPFICVENMTIPNFDNENFYGTKLLSEYYLGFAPGFRYTYNFKNGISIGINSSFNFAAQYGLISYSVSPMVSFRLQ